MTSGCFHCFVLSFFLLLSDLVCEIEAHPECVLSNEFFAGILHCNGAVYQVVKRFVRVVR